MELNIDAIFMNSGCSKTADIHILLPKLSDSQKTEAHLNSNTSPTFKTWNHEIT